MKNLLFFSFLVLSLASCMELGFKEPMPIAAQNIASFPENMRGTYVSTSDTGDTVVVEATTVSNGKFRLDDDNVMRAMGKYYVISKREEGRWNLALIKPNGNNAFTLYGFDIADAKKRKTLTRITEVEEVLDAEGGLDYLFIQPTDKQFEKLVRSKCVRKAEKFKKIK